MSSLVVVSLLVGSAQNKLFPPGRILEARGSGFVDASFQSQQGATFGNGVWAPGSPKKWAAGFGH